MCVCVLIICVSVSARACVHACVPVCVCVCVSNTPQAMLEGSVMSLKQKGCRLPLLFQKRQRGACFIPLPYVKE